MAHLTTQPEMFAAAAGILTAQGAAIVNQSAVTAAATTITNR